ncbi:flagellar hook-length control protein FliK [Tuberibacillus sp. Marseille-P3662]|uniref:flagellar hook-length control protein FliK n=1 Tax=Tuberibacillus sp. Marseille-P3662 TaxID=1965358 RepID=UPI000A1CCE1F|nr:flagellar hook-length control protein FliK [Tuberibacillus sp. Marseille-P3662]
MTAASFLSAMNAKSLIKPQARTGQAQGGQSVPFSSYLKGDKNSAGVNGSLQDLLKELKSLLNNISETLDQQIKLINKDEKHSEDHTGSMEHLSDQIQAVIQWLDQMKQQGMLSGSSQKQQWVNVLSTLHNDIQSSMSMSHRQPNQSLTKEFQNRLTALLDQLPKMDKSRRTGYQRAQSLPDVKQQTTMLPSILQTTQPKFSNVKAAPVTQTDTSFQSGTMDKMQQLIWHQTNEQTSKNSIQQQIIQKIDHLTSKGQLTFTNHGKQQFTIKLIPDQLGRLDVTIVKDVDGMHAKIAAHTAAAKDILQSQVHQLKQAFQGQQLNVQRLDIQLAPHSSESDQQGQDGQQSGQPSGQQSEEEQGHSFNDAFDEDNADNHDDDTPFLDWLEKEVMRHEH